MTYNPTRTDSMPAVQPVMPGAEPFRSDGGPAGVLVLHGFTGNPQSMRPLALAIAAEGYAVELPLLPGHGTAIEDLLPTRWPDWAQASENALSYLAERCESVAVVALSMGGTLACRIAQRHPEVRGLVLVNPFVEPPADSYRTVTQEILDQGMEIAPAIGSSIASPDAKELSYDGTPLRAAQSLFEGVDEVAAGLARIECPVLLMSSRHDPVVPNSNGDFLVARVSGPVERVWLERSYHVATLDYDAPEIETRTLEFLAKVL